MNAENRQIAVVSTQDPTALMQVITRAASDPTVDVDKLERMMAMYERIDSRRSDQSFSDAMSIAQGEMRPIARDSTNSQTYSKYASYGALDNELRPIYTKYGFGLSFSTVDCPKAEHIRVECRVSHRDGHVERPFLDMPVVTKGPKGNDLMTLTHATMSAVSYARRGLLKMIFNLAEGEFDDDGNGGKKDERPVYLTDEQQQNISQILNENGFSVSIFMQWAQVESMGDILLESYPKILAALRRQIAAKKGTDAGSGAAERQAKEMQDAEDRAAGRVPDDDVAHDPETGEITADQYAETASALTERFQKASSLKILNELVAKHQPEIEAIAEVSPESQLVIQHTIDARRKHFAR